MAEQRRLMELRKKMNEKRPSFRRVESWRHKKLNDSWRKARGIDSQTRKKTKTGVKSPGPGYRGPKKVRGIHPSGYEEVRIFLPRELDELNPKKHAIKIAKRLGSKKRIALIDLAQNKGFKILNIGITQEELETLESMLDSEIDELEDEEDLLDLDDLDELEDEDY